jgi:hypothetical protein
MKLALLLCCAAAASSPTTDIARQLVLERIAEIERDGSCRASLHQERIGLDLLRATARRTRFYNVLGREGRLRFSQVVGRPSSPDETLDALNERELCPLRLLAFCRREPS